MKHVRPFIIPVFLPHAGCPYRCVFCNQKKITGTDGAVSIETIQNHINQFLNYSESRDAVVEIAFYGGNFLGINPGTVHSLLEIADAYIKNKTVHSIRFSTRPDTITEKQLSLISGFPVSTIELGVQSMDDDVLAMSNRGHTAEDTEQAVVLLKKNNYKIGLQMMTGLPGDDDAKALETARKLADFLPDFVRIYPTIVISGSPLAEWHARGEYAPMTLPETVSLVKKIYLLFKEKNIPVIRMGLQATEELDNGTTVIAGPYHPAFGHLVLSDIFFDKAAAMLKSTAVSDSAVTIRVHPQNISRMRGLKNENIDRLKSMFNLKEVNVSSDVSLSDEEIALLPA